MMHCLRNIVKLYFLNKTTRYSAQYSQSVFCKQNNILICLRNTVEVYFVNKQQHQTLFAQYSHIIFGKHDDSVYFLLC